MPSEQVISEALGLWGSLVNILLWHRDWPAESLSSRETDLWGGRVRLGRMQEGGTSASSKVSLVPGLKQGCSLVLAVSPHSTSQRWGGFGVQRKGH